VGIFISTDPADVLWNSYSYVGGNPIIAIDPTGAVPDLAYIDGADGSSYIQACQELYALSPETFEAIMADPTVISYDILTANINAFNPTYFFHFLQGAVTLGGLGEISSGYFYSFKTGLTHTFLAPAENMGADLSLSWNIGFGRGWPGGSANTTNPGAGPFGLSFIDDGSRLNAVTGGIGVSPFPGAMTKGRAFTTVGAPSPPTDWSKNHNFGWGAGSAPAGYCSDCFDY
jgi:hypothetical protein